MKESPQNAEKTEKNSWGFIKNRLLGSSCNLQNSIFTIKETNSMKSHSQDPENDKSNLWKSNSPQYNSETLPTEKIKSGFFNNVRSPRNSVNTPKINISKRQVCKRSSFGNEQHTKGSNREFSSQNFQEHHTKTLKDESKLRRSTLKSISLTADWLHVPSNLSIPGVSNENESVLCNETLDDDEIDLLQDVDVQKALKKLVNMKNGASPKYGSQFRRSNVITRDTLIAVAQKISKN
jgi:hypothetical protein